MKAISGIFVMLLLVSGVFAISVTGGEDQTSLTSAVSISEIATEEIDASQVSDVLSEVGNIENSKLKRLGFVNLWRGHGWVENGQEGRLIHAIWAVQKYAEVDSLDSDSNPNYTTGRTFGRIHISGDKMYKLVRYLDETDEKHINFHVVPLNKKVNSENAKDYAVGKLSVTLEEVMGDFSTWTGTLKMYSDSLSGSGDVELGVIFKKVRGNGLREGGLPGIQKIRAETVVGGIAKQSAEDDVEVVGIGKISGYDDKDYSDTYDSIEVKSSLKAEKVEASPKKSFWNFLKFW